MLVTRLRRFKIFHRYVGMPSCLVTNRNDGNRQPPLFRQTWTILSGSSSSSCFAQAPKIGVRYFSLTSDDHRTTKPAINQNNLKLKKKQLTTLSPDSKTTLPVNSTNLFEHTKEICDETIYPFRAFSRNEGYCRYFNVVFCEVIAKAERLLHDKYNFNNTVGSNELQISNTINLAFQLLIRINREPWKLNYKWEPLYLFKHKPLYTNMLLRVWDMAALQNEPNLRTAQEVTQLVGQIILSNKDVDSHSHKEQTRYDIATIISMILPVAIHEARVTVGPLQSTRVLSNIDSAQAPQATADTSPKKLVLCLYNALLKADAESKSSDFNETLKRMFDLIEEIRVKHAVQPDVTTYNILLRFLRLSNGSSLERFESAFQLMQLDNIAPNMSTYNEVVQSYSSSNNENVNHEKFGLAEQYLKQMIDLILKVEPVSTNEKLRKNTGVRQQYESDVKAISNCAHNVMDAYVRDLMSQSSIDRQQEIVDQAKELFLLLDKTNIIPNSSIQQLSRKIIDIYKSMLSEQIKPDAVTFCTVVKHLTKSPNNLEMVDKLLQESESNQHYPSNDSYALLIQAYIRICDAENATRVLFRWFGVARDRRNKISKDDNLVLESMTPLYHQLAQLWIQLGDLERATTVTEEIYEFHMDANKNNSSNNDNKQAALSPKPEPPSVQTYILLHQAWEKSHHQLKDEYLTQIKAKILPYI